MSFPWVYEENWDDGSKGNFDTETDASAIQDYPNYAELARHGLHPWRGAHALRLQLNGTAVSQAEEAVGFDTALGGTIHVWFPVLLAENLNIAVSGLVVLFTMQSTGAVEEVSVGVRNNAGVYELYCGETGLAATRSVAITRSNKKWHEIEVSATIDSGAPGDGTIDFYVDGAQVGAQITGLDQAAISEAQLGAVIGTSAGDSGTILIGGIVADDARIYPRHQARFGQSHHITQDITAYIGPGTLDAASVTGSSTDAVMSIYDTDIFTETGIGYSREDLLVSVQNVTANDTTPGFNTPIEFKKGVTVVLTGTNPQAYVTIKEPSSVVMSGANYVDRGKKRPKDVI